MLTLFYYVFLHLAFGVCLHRQCCVMYVSSGEAQRSSRSFPYVNRPLAAQTHLSRAHQADWRPQPSAQRVFPPSLPSSFPASLSSLFLSLSRLLLLNSNEALQLSSPSLHVSHLSQRPSKIKISAGWRFLARRGVSTTALFRFVIRGFSSSRKAPSITVIASQHLNTQLIIRNLESSG